MAARRTASDRLASVLLWIGRIIAGAWAIIFLLSLIGEVASGYQPGGSAFTSAQNFADGILLLLKLLPLIVIVEPPLVELPSLDPP